MSTINDKSLKDFRKSLFEYKKNELENEKKCYKLIWPEKNEKNFRIKRKPRITISFNYYELKELKSAMVSLPLAMKMQSYYQKLMKKF